MVVTPSGNRLADVLYSVLFSETLCVVMWTIVLSVMCLAALSMNALLSRKQGRNAVMSVRRKRNSNITYFAASDTVPQPVFAKTLAAPSNPKDAKKGPPNSETT